MPNPFGDRKYEDQDEAKVNPFGDTPETSGTGAYVANRAKKGLVAGTLGMGGLVADVAEMGARDLSNELTNPETLFNRLIGGGRPPVEDPDPFDKTRKATEFGEGMLGVDTDMEAPTRGVARLGGIAEFAASGAIPGALVVRAAKHKIPALVAESMSSVGGGVGQEEFGPWGGVIGGLGAPAVGQAIYQGGARLLPHAGALKDFVQGSRSPSVMAGRDLTNALGASPESGMNLTRARDVATEVERLGGQPFEPTLGQASSAPGVLAMEKRIASSTPEDLARHAERLSAQERAVSGAESAAFPKSGSVSGVVRPKMSKIEQALEGRLAVINDAETRLAGQFPDINQQRIGEALDDARIQAFTIARGVKNEKYQKVYKAADSAGIREDMSDVRDLARSLKDENVFQNFPSVFKKVLDRYDVKAGKPPTPSGILDEYGTPIPPTPKPAESAKPASFEEFHSLWRETNTQLNVARRTGDADGEYYLGQVKSLLDQKISKYGKGEYGEVAQLFNEANDFFANKYAKVFREGVGGRLDARGRYGELIKDEDTVKRFFTPTGIDDFNQIFEKVPAAHEVLNNGVMGLFAQNAVRDGSVNPKLAQTWLRRHKDALDKLPDVRSKLSDAVQAEEAIIRARALTLQRQKNIDKTVVAQLAKSDNPDALIASAFDNPDQLRGLASLATDPKSRAAIARSVMTALPDVAARKGVEPLQYMLDNADALRPLLNRLGADHEKNLRTIAAARGVMSRSPTPKTVAAPGITDELEKAIGTSRSSLTNMVRSVFMSRGRSGASGLGTIVAARFFNKRAFEAQESLTKAALYDQKIADDLAKALKAFEGRDKASPAIVNKIGNHLLSLGYKSVATAEVEE